MSFSCSLLARLTIGAALPAIAIASTPAFAQATAQRSFDIPAQSLESALLLYMRQSGVQVGYEPADVAGRSSTGISGALTTGEALSRLLGGTGLTYRSTGGTSVRLQAIPRTGGNAVQLGPVRVQGAGNGPAGPIETATGPVPGYRAALTATATRTDSAIRDVPQSIQIVPRTVIEDQAAVRLTDVIQNVSSVQLNGTAGNRAETYNIRGFVASRYAINGFPLTNAAERPEAFLDLANVERVEVLKGPASVMVGLTDPGGVINIVTRAPTEQFSLDGSFQAGSFDFYRSELSVSGPLNASGTLTARVTGALQTDGGFRDEARDSERAFGAAALRWEPDTLTRVDLTADYLDSKQPFDRGLYADENGNHPRDAGNFLGEKWSTNASRKLVLGLAAQRQVVPWLMLRFTGRYTDATSFDSNGVDLQGLEADNRTLRRRVTTRTEAPEDLTMRFEGLIDAFTGGIEHRIMMGVEHNRGEFFFNSARANIGSIDIYNPVYGATPIPVTRQNARYDRETRNWGYYLQDQISLGEQWKALLGLRYDTAKSHQDDIFNDEIIRTSDDALTWRAGLVYQPTNTISVYASYTRSFIPQTGQLIDGTPLAPEKGEQFEGGVKLDIIPDALSLTAAVFQTTKQNVATDDPTDSDFSILTGEQRVRGVEFDLTGEILPGWNIIANAAYLDTEITRDNVFAIGNRLTGVPELSGRLWTSYSVRSGTLKGLSVGGGIRVATKRQIDLDNSFTIEGYETFDASIRYAIDEHWEASVNAQNLTDRFYIEGVQSESNLYAGTPRRVMGTVRARF
ncbi:TonB-dependent siderophore receptor [Sphingomonas crocodyli]|uniref:TonB-dependent receptor n=1 Tax=Sphingomonas crocodyli TaxID=1979270 RepID=A0A437M937_9SPHN|nr:TonB-dependent receptor [Sphingomonas crocodyli]RVT94230.1 TonB-dependent receptor [Sphingomonas crocodyli]